MKRRRPPSEPQVVGDILESLLAKKESEVVAPRQRAEKAWIAICLRLDLEGTQVAGFKAGALQIEVASPPLCAELSQFRRAELEDELATELGDTNPIKSLRFRLGVFK